MLSSKYNLLTLEGLQPSGTYLDQLPKDLVWYMLGYTGPKDGYVVMKKPYFNRGPLTIEKCTTLATKQELEEHYISQVYYGPQFMVEKVKFIFIDGKQYAAVPIKGKIDGFTPPKTKKNKNSSSKKTASHRCVGRNVNGSRCKHKTTNTDKLCKTHIVN